MFLAGDLNSPPTAPEVRLLTRVAIDTGAAANGPDSPGHTLSPRNPLAPPAWQIGRRIDYVLARPGMPARRVEVERSFLAGDPVDGLHRSDHFAVVTDVRI